MSKIRTAVNLLTSNPRQFMLTILMSGKFRAIPDSRFLKILYYLHFGEKLNLEKPKTYNEKMQWLKIYDRRPEYTIWVDKYLVKEYVAGIIGEQYIIPTLGKWDSFDEIDFDELPEQFVLKCNHDSGSVVICKDKKAFDKNKAARKLNRGLKRNLFWATREWPYKDIRPCIIAEKYIEDDSGELLDYKIYTFEGKSHYLMIISDRFKGKDYIRKDFYDTSLNHLDLVMNGAKNDGKLPQGVDYRKLFELAEILAKGTHHLRVDFFVVNGKIYFGELTFFDASGFDYFKPKEWDAIFGEHINVP